MNSHATASSTVSANPDYGMDELRKESRMGDLGVETTAREVRRIDLSNFEQRKAQIADELWNAAVDIGFFQVYNHGISQQAIQDAFAMTERFFDLPPETKALRPLNRNAGWESKTQVRPSVRTADQKESYQITRPRMQGPVSYTHLTLPTSDLV